MVLRALAFLFVACLLIGGSEYACARPAGVKQSPVSKLSSPAKISVPADMQAEIDRYCGYESKTLGGAEYVPQRQVGRGQLSSCMADCYVVIYLVTGVPNRDSNNNTQYMAAFTYNNGKPLLLAGTQVGGRGLRYVTIKSIGPDNIKLSTEYYLPKDNLDTPSGRGHATFVIASKHLIETP